jgi:hypothetical protein
VFYSAACYSPPFTGWWASTFSPYLYGADGVFAVEPGFAWYNKETNKWHKRYSRYVFTLDESLGYAKKVFKDIPAREADIPVMESYSRLFFCDYWPSDTDVKRPYNVISTNNGIIIST